MIFFFAGQSGEVATQATWAGGMRSRLRKPGDWLAMGLMRALARACKLTTRAFIRSNTSEVFLK